MNGPAFPGRGAPLFASAVATLFCFPAAGVDNTVVTKGPFIWQDGGGQMQVTVTVDKKPNNFPGLYRWDYEVRNLSIGSCMLDPVVNGIAGFELSIANWSGSGGGIPDLANIYGPPNWAFYTITSSDGAISEIQFGSEVGADPYPAPGGGTAPLYSIAPGSPAVHFGFTTLPREILDLPQCEVLCCAPLNFCGRG